MTSLFNCRHCGRKFKRKANLKEHMFVHMKKDKIPRFMCRIGNCGYHNSRVGNLNIHLSCHHGIEIPVLNCRSEKCKLTRKREESIVIHMKKCKHKPEFHSLFCNVSGCKAELCTLEGLRTHMRVEHSEIPESVTLKDLMNFPGKFFREK